MAKVGKYIKEIVLFFIVLFIITNGISLYRSSSMQLSDGVCEGGADMIHFFATWCPVCELEAPNIDRVSKHFNIVSVAVKSKDIDEYMAKNRYSFAYIDDINGSLAKEADIQAFPTTITCKDKKVFFVDVGYTSTFGLYLKLFLAKVL